VTLKKRMAAYLRHEQTRLLHLDVPFVQIWRRVGDHSLLPTVPRRIDFVAGLGDVVRDLLDGEIKK